ncbi:MAG: YybH family protein [Phormidesmis sp.]
MTSEEIRAIAVGKTTFGTFADRPLSYAVYVAPGGRLIGQLMDGSSDRIETGTWRIENDRLIGQWDSFKDGEANAFAYVQVGSNVHAIRDDGSLDRVQFFVDGDPLGLDAGDATEEVKAVVNQWIALWNPGENPIDAKRFAQFADIFAEGDGYLAVDDFTGEVLTLRSYATYAETWEPVMTAFSSWSIERVGDIDVDLSGDTAITYFEFEGNGILQDGTEVEGYSHSTLILRRIEGQWRIVHEHLTNAEPPAEE